VICLSTTPHQISSRSITHDRLITHYAFLAIHMSTVDIHM
jgi:hypothetical protein